MNMDNYKEQNIPWEGFFVKLNASQVTKMTRCIAFELFLMIFMSLLRLAMGPTYSLQWQLKIPLSSSSLPSSLQRLFSRQPKAAKWSLTGCLGFVILMKELDDWWY